MLSHNDPVNPAQEAARARRRIRRLASFWMTPWMWVFGFGKAIVEGATVDHAVIIASTQACAGLIGWWGYHLISRRNDGLAVFILALIVTSPKHDVFVVSDDIRWHVRSGCVLIAINWILAVLLLPFGKKSSVEPEPPANSLEPGSNQPI